VQRPLADPWSEGGNNETNQQIYDALQRAKIEVKKEYPTPSLFKLMIFRMSRSTAKLMLNENYRDYTYYREHGWFESNYYYRGCLVIQNMKKRKMDLGFKSKKKQELSY